MRIPGALLFVLVVALAAGESSGQESDRVPLPGDTPFPVTVDGDESARQGPGSAPASSSPDAKTSSGREAISSNPAAVNIIAGTGALGRFLGLEEDSGIRLGGLWIGDA